MAAATLTISASEVDSLIANPSSVIGYSSTKNIVITGSITHTQASGLKSVTSPSITATVTQTSVANLKAITVLSGRTNAFTLTTSDGTAAAADLNTISSLTSVAPNFSSITAVTASPAADLISLYAATNSTLGNEPVTVSDTSVAAADLVTINSKTDGVVTISATTITGSTADLVKVYKAFDTNYTDPATVAGLGNEVVTITDVTVNAEELRFIELATTGQVNIGTSATSIAGNYTDVNSVLGQVTNSVDGSGNITDGKISGLATLDVTLDDSSSSTFGNNTTGTVKYSVANINTIAGLTTGTVTAVVNETELDTVKGLTTAGNYTVTIATDGAGQTVAAADLKAVLAKVGTGTITVTSNITGVDGAYADVFAVYDSTKISGLGDETNAISDGITVAQANALDAKNAGTITATISANDMATLNTLTLNTDSNGDAVAHAYTITVTDNVVDADKLNTLDSKTSVDLVVDNATSLTGTLAGVKAAYAASDAVNPTIKAASFGDETVTISDTEIIAADLKAIDTATSGLITLSGVTKVTGTATDIHTLMDSAGVTGLTTANTAIIITGSAAEAVDLVAIEAHTTATGLITIDPSTTAIKGSVSDVTTVFTKATTVTTVGSEFTRTIEGPLTANVTLDDGANGAQTYTVKQINTIAGKTTGIITASVTDSTADNKDNDIDALLGARVSGASDVADHTIAENGHAISVRVHNESNGQALSAEKLVLLNSITTGAVTVHSNITSLAGTAADMKTIYADHGTGKGITTGLAAMAITLDDTTVEVADVIAISNVLQGGTAGVGTTGMITANNATELRGTATELHAFIDEADKADNAKKNYS